MLKNVSIWSFILALGLVAKIRGVRETVGIDVGHYSIKYVKVLHSASGERIVVDAALEKVRDGEIVNGEIQTREGGENPAPAATEFHVKEDVKPKGEMDAKPNGENPATGSEQKKELPPKSLEDAMSALLAQHPIGDSDVVVSVNAGAGVGGVLVDRLAVKVPKNGNESAIILQTAMARPPFDDQDNVLDYDVYSRENDELKVNVVAAKSGVLDSWARFFVRKDVRPVAMDVDIFGLVNSYVATADSEDLKKTVALINIGEKKMSIAFIQDGVFHSMRPMTGGSLDIVVSNMCKNLGITAKKCHEVFEEGKLSIVDGFSEAEVEAALKISYDDLITQMDFGIRYFSSLEDAKNLEKILLGGGGAAIPGLKEAVAEHFGLESENVDTVNPFRLVECDKKVVGAKGISVALSNIYAPALGLAMRKF